MRSSLRRVATFVRRAEPARRRAFAAMVAAGLVAVALGLALRSGVLALVGLLLTVPQTLDAVLSVRDSLLRADRSVDDDGLEWQRRLARRMLASHREAETTPSLPGGATIEVDFLSEADMVTFRSADDRVARFGGLLAAIKDVAGPLVLLGAPGSGKSLTARRIVLSLLDEATTGDGPLAERFLLSRWDGTPMIEWLAREWASRQRYGLDLAEARRLVVDPEVVLVLDGLDEMPVARRLACVEAINAMIDVHPLVRLVVCCRNREYQALEERVDSRRVRRIAPLDEDTIRRFITAHGPSTWSLVRDRVPDDRALSSLLSTPLMLVAALRAFRDDPGPLLTGTLADREHALWDGYVDRMLRAGEQPVAPLAQRRRWLEEVAVTLAATGPIQPERANRDLRLFLEHCVDRHLLRRSAAGYEPIHRRLLGHLVARASFDGGSRALHRRLLVPIPPEDEAEVWNRLASEALAAGHPDAAVRLSGRALAIEPNNPTYLSDHAFHLLAAGRPRQAVDAARDAEAADPGDWRPPSTLACALFALGDLEASATARGRAWANGHRRRDGELLAYVLALRGFHDEAGAVLDKLRAIGGDDPARMDRALALAAMGRAGAAADALFPLDYVRFNAAFLIFSVPAEPARRLLPGDTFEIVEREPGRAQLNVIVLDHHQNPWGEYEQILFNLEVRPIGAPQEAAGGFVFGRFVNEWFSPEAAHRTLALPGTLADIDVTYRPGELVLRLEVDGQRTLALRLPRVAPQGEPERIETSAYSEIGGIPYAMTIELDFPTGVAADPNAVDVRVGAGEAAEALRSLGLPRAPDSYAWGEDLSLTLHLPRPLGTR